MFPRSTSCAPLVSDPAGLAALMAECELATGADARLDAT